MIRFRVCVRDSGGWVWGAGLLANALNDPNVLLRQAARIVLENLSGERRGEDRTTWLEWLQALPKDSVCWDLVNDR